MKIQLVSFIGQDLFFSMKLLRFVSKAIKLLLTELVGQCGKVCGQYIPALTSHSVNKSIVLPDKIFMLCNKGFEQLVTKLVAIIL